MKQSSIILGEGLTDLLESLTLIEYNHARIDKVVYFRTPQSDKQLSSVTTIMSPTTGKQFRAIYMMLSALKYPYSNSNKKFETINEQVQSYDIPIVGIDVQPPNTSHTNDLYFKYLISVLRLQNWIPPMQ